MAKSGPKSRTGEWKPAFLRALRNCGNVRASCQAAGVSKQMAYAARKKSVRFAKEWEDALEDALEILEAEARRRALATSDTMLIFLLKSHKPDVYNERLRIEGMKETTINIDAAPRIVVASMDLGRPRAVVEAEAAKLIAEASGDKAGDDDG